jgi:hypothetical protein
MKMEKRLAMVVTKKPQAAPITTVGDQFFVRLAKELKGELAPAKLALVKTRLESWAKSLEAFQDNVRERILAALKSSGKQVTDKGALELREGEYILAARPWRTGYDGKKVEALLRAKQADVTRWMDQEVKYKLNDQKLGAAVEAGVLTQEELDASCRAGLDGNGEVIMAVQPIKKVES